MCCCGLIRATAGRVTQNFSFYSPQGKFDRNAQFGTIYGRSLVTSIAAVAVFSFQTFRFGRAQYWRNGTDHSNWQ